MWPILWYHFERLSYLLDVKLNEQFKALRSHTFGRPNSLDTGKNLE